MATTPQGHCTNFLGKNNHSLRTDIEFTLEFGTESLHLHNPSSNPNTATDNLHHCTNYPQPRLHTLTHTRKLTHHHTQTTSSIYLQSIDRIYKTTQSIIVIFIPLTLSPLSHAKINLTLTFNTYTTYPKTK